MKGFLLSFILILFAFIGQAQTQLWGMTNSFGSGAGGTIFNTDGSGNNYSVKHNLFLYNGMYPTYTNLLKASDGMFYGVTRADGSVGDGVIFQYNPYTDIYINKIYFDNANIGSSPKGSLMQTSNGMIYGMTDDGGASDLGVIFQYDPLTNVCTKKFDFNGASNGSHPQGTLVEANNGMLYGFTNEGGTFDYGVLFEFNPNTGVFTKKFDFNGTLGRFPRGFLLLAANGSLYGASGNGGSQTQIFQYDPIGDIFTPKVNLPGGASDVYGSLIQTSDGKIYGLARDGGANYNGIIFQYDYNTNICLKKFDFNWTPTGADPYGSLTLASDGMLYGMASEGGVANSHGVLFQFNPSTGVYNKKFDFYPSYGVGRLPQASLIELNGALYGLTTRGGINDSGVLFRFDISTGTYTKKLDFNSSTNGKYPYGSLVQTPNGKLYGITKEGGSNSDGGVLFEFDPGLNIYSKKINLSSVGCANVYGSLVLAEDGNLYGLSYSNKIFQYIPGSDSLSVKFSSTNSADGSSSFGSLIKASDGYLYGLTSVGGINNKGVIFQFDINTNTFTKKIDFDNVGIGRGPLGSLIQASNGLLYGLTKYGGVNDMGVLFQYNPITNICTKKVNFNGVNNGSYPSGSLIQASDGKIYGMTHDGGVNNKGIFFQYDINADTLIKKLDFGAGNGSSPLGTLMQASNGLIYGMTTNGGAYGGAYGYGVLFQYDPFTETFTKKLDFDRNTGMHPMYTGLIEIGGTISTGNVNTIYCTGDSITVPYTISGIFIPGNVFTIQLSDEFGSFISPTNIGNIISCDSGSITALIPLSIIQSNQYRIRVVSSNPLITVTDNANNIIINASTFSITNLNICSNALPYIWNNNILNTSDSLTVHFSNIAGCDSTATLNLIVNEPVTSHNLITLCANESITIGSNTYFASGTFIDTLSTINGCDSIITTELNINLPIINSQTIRLCYGQSIFVETNNYAASGNYTDTLVAYNGCDSIVLTNLTIDQSISSTQTYVLCNGESIIVGSNIYSFSGNYIDTLLTSNGCDSIVATNLSISPPITTTQTIELCDHESIIVGSNVYSLTGNYIDTLAASNGCDSIISTFLNITPTIFTTQTIELCANESITVGSNIYSSTGNYTDTLISSDGCDSIVTINLTVQFQIDTSITVNDITLSANATSVLYQWIDCDSTGTFILGATSQSFNGNVAGNYAVVLTSGNCSDTSRCVNIINTNIKQGGNYSGIQIFPNPTNSFIYLKSDLILDNSTIYLHDITGRIVFSQKLNTKQNFINISNIASGIYHFKLNYNNSIIYQTNIIKE